MNRKLCFLLVFCCCIFLTSTRSSSQCRCESADISVCLDEYSDFILKQIQAEHLDLDCVGQIQDHLVELYTDYPGDELALVAHRLRVEVGILLGDYYSAMLDLTRHLEIQMSVTGSYQRPDIRNEIEPDYLEPAEALAWGLYNERNGHYAQALEYFKTGLESPLVCENFLAYTKALKYVMSLARFLGQYELAQEVATARYNYIVAVDTSDYFLLGECLNDLGMVYLESGDYDMVDVYLDSSLAVRKKLPIQVSFGPVGNAHDSKGTYYLKLKDYSSALSEFKLALEQFEQVEKIGHNPDIPVCYSNMGHCYRNLGQYEQATEAYEQSLLWFPKVKGKHFHYTSHIHLRLAELNLELGQFESARSWLSKSKADLDSLGFTSVTQDIQTRLVEFEISGMMDEEGWTWESGFLELDSMIALAYEHPDVSTSWLITLHRRKLKFYKEHSIQSLAPLMDESLELDARIRRETYGLSTAGKVHSSSLYRQYIADLISYVEPYQSNMDNQHWSSLLVLVESAKSELRRKYSFEHAIRVSKSEEAVAFGRIVSEIAGFERKLNTLGAQENGQLKSRLRLLELYDERNALISKTGWNDQPKQLLLSANSLHFFESERQIFRISSFQRNREISIVGSREELNVQVQLFHEALSSNDAGKYLLPAYALSNILIGDIHVEELDIYPDGIVQTIPFDALLRSAKGGEEFWEMDYWIKHARFNYPLEAINSEENEVSAFLIDGESLPGSFEEANQIESMFGGRALNDAKELREYLSATDQLGILHLAVHGKHNPYNPLASYLLLPGNDGRDTLEGHELMAFPVIGKLASLAACESGMSSLMENSESLSLSSFFHAAGFENTITSLWLANDHSTSAIFSDFYRRLAKGQEMAQALHESKKSFLKENKAQHASPLYWAHLRLSGSGGEVAAHSNEMAWYWFLLLMIPGYLIFRRRSAA